MSTDRPTVLIVGSGAAGLMAALRLADTAQVTLIEAGADAGSPPPRWLLEDFVLADTVDWGIQDEETGRTILRGRLTGGSTSVNSAAALRGQPWCFDEWNVPGWSWADVAPAFAAIETDREFGDAPHHGSIGPLPIGRLPFGPIDDGFAVWAQAQGHAWVEDQNAPGALGVGMWPSNMVGNGQRWGVHAAVLPLLRDRITLRASTEVTRLLLEDGRCVGVEAIGPNGPEELRADHVILSAGALMSPVLLMRSGIGPRAVLEAAGIPVVTDAPGVGENLQDHPWSVLTVRATDADAPGARPINGALLRYEALAEDRVEVHLYPHQALPYVPGSDPADVFVGIGLMRATSRGRVAIDADGGIRLRMGHLTSGQDRAAWDTVLADAARYVDEMVAAGVFEPPVDPWWRSPDREAAIRENLDSYGHAVGTCRLGTAADADAVVDPDLAVRGVPGLSIADASVMPTSPRANTMLSSMVVGWHGAGLIADRLVPSIPHPTPAGGLA